MGKRDGILKVNLAMVVALSNMPLQRLNAIRVRTKVGTCRDAACWRPRLLAAVIRSNAAVGVHR
jgi:hypothetical protein